MAPRTVTFTRILSREEVAARASKIWQSRSSFSTSKKQDEALAGTVVGKDNLRNRPKIKLQGSTQTITATRGSEPSYGTSVVINKTNSRIGGRRMSVTSSRLIPTSPDTALSQSYEDTETNITGCIDNDPSNFNPNPPDPPEPDPDPDDPPPNPPGNPNDPEAPPEPAPTPNGCSPSDFDQWYNASGPGSENCPAGTTFKGFAEVPEGTFMVLCGGSSRPPGDGCPEETVGYSCVNGSCAEVPNGTYSTIEQCQAADCSESALGYICNGSSCQQVPLSEATYATLEECQNNCTPPESYDIVNGLCTPSDNGSYGSLTECGSYGGLVDGEDLTGKTVQFESRCNYENGTLITDWITKTAVIPLRQASKPLDPGAFGCIKVIIDSTDTEITICSSTAPTEEGPLCPARVETRNFEIL